MRSRLCYKWLTIQTKAVQCTQIRLCTNNQQNNDPDYDQYHYFVYFDNKSTERF